MPADLTDKVYRYITENRMFNSGFRVLAGVSGGADSTCLLLMLCEMRERLGISIEVVHVNHGVRAEAGEDAEFVRQLCTRLDVPFTLRCVDMEGYASEHGLSSEEAGRILRYDIFNEIMDKDRLDVTAVAHNSNDRAETVEFNLFRGSGLKGMCGIEPVHGRIVRPLLCISRSEIEKYLEEQEQPYMTDRTNLSDDYARNRIRHNILAYAEEKICSGAIRHINETADMLTEVQAYVDRQTQKAFDDSVISYDNGYEIDMEKFMSNDIVIQKAVILRCFEKLTPHRKDITQTHIKAVIGLSALNGSGGIDLPYGLRAEKTYGRLYIAPRKSVPIDTDATEIYVPDLPCMLDLKGIGQVSFTMLDNDETGHIDITQNECTKYFDYDKITSCLLWRRRRSGDYLMVDDSMHRQTLKSYMVNQKIPKNVRDLMYVLTDGSHIVWIPGYRISEYYKITAHTQKVIKVQLGNGEIDV